MSPPRTVYLHGFASGPTSRKAQYFRERFSERGLTLEIPDLSQRDFEHLTVGGQLEFLENYLEGAPAALIGSSLGGYLAALYASRHPEVSRLVLLAPAFGFASRWKELVGEAGLAEWRKSGKLSVYHFAERRLKDLAFGIYEESFRWAPNPVFPQSAWIFHGLADTVVLPESSRIYAAQHVNVSLMLLHSDHELGNVLPIIWHAISSWFPDSKLQTYDHAPRLSS